MSIVDLIKMAGLNLWHRKFRTAFNLVGIVIGNVILLMALAETTEFESHSTRSLTQAK